VSEHLRVCGFGAAAASAKAELFARCATALAELTSAPPAAWRAFCVPGRIEVLGKHTDYAGGSSMVAAAERGFALLSAPADDSHVIIDDAGRRESVQFVIGPELTPGVGHWSNYPMTVARRVARNFAGATRGARIALASDLPPAAGMSSSSALMVAVFFALADANDLSSHADFPSELSDPLHLAGYLATIENGQSYGKLAGDRGVGTFGGSEDHTAILCARPGRIRQYAYCPVRFEKDLSLPPECTLAVATSGVVAEKTGAARDRYNRASRLATALAELWRDRTGRAEPHLAAVLRSGPDATDELRRILANLEHGEFSPDDLQARLAHFVVENEQVIPAAGQALRRGDVAEFGRCVDRSQQCAERLLGNQIPETCYLAAAAREHGALAASAFGAGFGGSVWALIERARTEAFLALWQNGYRARFPQHSSRAEFFATDAGPPLLRVA
jgi:galactokinase